MTRHIVIEPHICPRYLTNQDRADMVLPFVEGYHAAHYGSSAGTESMSTVIRDMVANLMHLADRQLDDDGADDSSRRMLARAQMYYDDELLEENPAIAERFEEDDNAPF